MPMPQSASNSQRSDQLSSHPFGLLLAWLVPGLLMLLPAASALALVHFDFDQKFFVHPHRQVWDFSIVRPDSVYHIFYHSIHEETPNAAAADTIWHATSGDLKHWVIEDPILTVGQGYWDEGAIWAPDVFFDQTNQKWMLAYTGCDNQFNQRICLASSDDLYTWTKSPSNPAIMPDTNRYVWSPDAWWSDFRDPFIFQQESLYHMLVTAKEALDEPTGVIYHGVSFDLNNWMDVGPLFVNDGPDPWRVLESPQYAVLDGNYYLLFGEFDTLGTSAIAADSTGRFSMANRTWIDYGYAPEVDQFDPGIPIFSRIAPFHDPSTGLLRYVARMDTLRVLADGTLDPYQPHPLAEQWKSWTGVANIAQPTFGDNPAMRGDESVGLVGNGFYGTKEYFQGPLSGRGSAGTTLGDAAAGTLESDSFFITGTRMTLLVGGGNYPETCYVALMDADTDTIIYSETGANRERMSLRQWNLAPLNGRKVYIKIVDAENQAMGHINVDEIVEDNLAFSPVDELVPVATTLQHRAYPNPFNPRTRILFTLDHNVDLSVKIHDLRGRLVWSSGVVHGLAGENSVTWDGLTSEGTPTSAGTYLYSLEIGGRTAGSGKIALVK